jgi:hypothetical protein
VSEPRHRAADAKPKDPERKEAQKVSIATAVILNVVAVTGLLILLAATMRLPYHLPRIPGESRRRRRTAPATSRARHDRRMPEPVYSR